MYYTPIFDSTTYIIVNSDKLKLLDFFLIQKKTHKVLHNY